MDISRYKLTVSFPVTFHCATGVDVAGLVGETFDRCTYSDGRHDFTREAVARALEPILREAAREAARRHYEAIHGPAYEEYETAGSRCTRRLADRLADDWMRENFGGACVAPEGWKTTIEIDDSAP